MVGSNGPNKMQLSIIVCNYLDLYDYVLHSLDFIYIGNHCNMLFQLDFYL